MILTQEKPIKTGLTLVDEGRRKLNAATILPDLTDPTLKFDVGSSSRANQTGTASPYKLQDIQNGYMVDSYIHRGVNEMHNKIWKEGYFLECKDPKALEYINMRLELMTVATGEPWQTTIKRSTHDYVKLGNGFLIKQRYTKPVKNLNIQGVNKQKPIGGYYSISPLLIKPVLDETGNITAWEHRRSGGSPIIYKPDQIVHLHHNKQSGGQWGTSRVISVLDDVRILRQCEEMVVHLIFKSLNPIVHHELPDTLGVGGIRQQDLRDAASRHDISPVNGYLITPPGHKISIIGVESKALRAEGYLKIMKQRVFAGLGLSTVIAGEASTSSAGSADSFSSVMEDQTRLFQEELSFFISFYILRELLLEGGFDPLANPDQSVAFKFNESNSDRRRKDEEHAMLQYSGNIITEDEVRSVLKRPTLTDQDRAKLYINTVQIPLAFARFQADPFNNQTQNKVKPSNQHTKNSLVMEEYDSLMQDVLENRKPTVDLDSIPETVRGVFKEAIEFSKLTDSPSAIYGKFESMRPRLELLSGR